MLPVFLYVRYGERHLPQHCRQNWKIPSGRNILSAWALDLRYIDRDYYDKIIYLIDKFQLTKKNIKFKPEQIISLMFQDKKVQDGKINLILPTKFAEVELFDNIDLPSLKESLL